MGDGGTLPTLRNGLDVMSNNELSAFISQILRTITGVKPRFGDPSMKPEWWPGNLPFTSLGKDPRDQVDKTKKPWVDEMRNIVRQCYKYYGQEHLLHVDDAIKVVNNQDGSVSFITHNTVVTLEDRQNTPYASCPVLEAATPGRSLTASTGPPQPLPTGLFRSTTNLPAVTRSQKGTLRSIDGKPFVEVFMCFFCEGEFHQKSTLQRHQRECSQRPPELIVSSATKSRVPFKETITIVPRKPRKLIQEKVTFPIKTMYTESLGLLPLAKAESVRRQSLGRKVNCEVIEIEDNKPPKTPTTPRTPKSLISQLSRDASPPARLRLKMGEGLPEEGDVQSTKDGSDDEDSENGKSENGEESFRPRRVAPLLNIDITSLLGERVKKHIAAHFASMEAINSESTQKTYEDFCRTPTKISGKVIERLRSRGKDNFQMTFRKSKRLAPKYTHKYKFRRSEGHEFCRIVETKLNKRARALKRTLKKCRVVVQRLSKEDVLRLGTPKKMLSNYKQAAINRWIDDGRSHHVQSGGIASEQLSKPASLIQARSQKQAGLSNRHIPNILRRQGKHSQPIMPKAQQQALYHMLTDLSSPEHTGATGSPADLTPPNTPEEACVEEDDLIMMDDGSFEDVSHSHMSSTSLQLFQSQSSRSSNKLSKISSQDDVISISSAESESDLKVVSPESLKRAVSGSSRGSDLPQKKRKVEQSAALLFRCHLCFEEITCYDNANVYIKGHFSSKHNVYNIDLIEHLDASGNKVVSIVEVPTPAKKATSASVSKSKPPAKPTTLDSKKFYSKKCSRKTKPITKSSKIHIKKEKKEVKKKKVAAAVPKKVVTKKASEKIKAMDSQLKQSELRKKMRDTLRPIITVKAKGAKFSQTSQLPKKHKVLNTKAAPKSSKPRSVSIAKNKKKPRSVTKGNPKSTRPRKL